VPNFLKEIEIKEQLDLLRAHGYGEFVDRFLLNERSCTTKKGRTNKQGICRTMGWKQKEYDTTIAACRQLLEPEENEAEPDN
jgi:hypothetical protein